MDAELLERARAALNDCDADAVLALLRGVDGPGAAWFRALATARQADVLRVRLALRDATRAADLPDTAVLDVARSYAEAVLDELPSVTAWHVLADIVHARQGLPARESTLALAWDLVVLAAEKADSPDRPPLVLLLATLQTRMGDVAAATALARGAQDAARAARDADVFTAASVLLARLAEADGDATLGAAVLRHAERLARELGGEPAVALLRERAANPAGPLSTRPPPPPRR